VFFGEPDPTYRRVFDLVMASQAAGIAALRAGAATAAAVDAAARDVIAAGGYGEAFRHRLGHVLDHADEQQRQPAQQHVRADAVLAPVVDGPDVDGVLEVAVDALDLVQLLVAQAMSSVLRCVAGADEELAVELGFGGDLGRSMASLPVLLCRT
jgi:hypothetical protein